MRRATVVSLAALAVAGVSLLMVSPAAAITRAEANRIALQTLKPQRQQGDVILFGLPKPVAANAVVTELTRPALLKKPGKAAWLFWEDLSPGSMFQHPSVLLLVDDATGTVTLRRKLSYYPLVNGASPAFFASAAVYYGPSFRVYAKLAPVTPVAARPTRSPARRMPLGVPPGSLPNDCLLMVVLTPKTDIELANGRGAMAAWAGLATRLGMSSYVATSVGPISAGGVPGLQPPRYSQQVTLFDLIANVQALVEDGCTDIAIYVFGHGTKAPADPEILLGIQPLTKKQMAEGVEPDKKTLDPAGLAGLAGRFAGEAAFKFVVEACFAERFKGTLLAEPNVKIVVGSSNANEESKFNQSDNPELKKLRIPVQNPNRPEFTHGVVEGTIEVLLDDARVAGLMGMGDFLPRLLKAGFEGEQSYDRAALAGLTHPVEMDSLTTAAPPQYAILDLSHFHPPGSDTSKICGTIKGPPGAVVIVRLVFVANGQKADSQPSLIDSDGMFAFTATINTPGAYRIEIVVDGASVASEAYTVPDPPTQGPRPCG